MILQNEVPEGKGKGAKLELVTALEFYTACVVDIGSGVQCVVTYGADKKLSDHTWCKAGEFAVEFLARESARTKYKPGDPSFTPVYFSMAAFDAAAVRRWKGRTAANVVAVRGFWIDIEASAKKYDKPGGADKGYADMNAAYIAIRVLCKATGLRPNFMVHTGGGVHLHFILNESVSVAVWKGRAVRLAAIAAEHGLKIDVQCTTDAARIMRAPGSIHQVSGELVQAFAFRKETYTLDEWDKLIGYDPATTFTPLPRIGTGTDSRVTGINGDVLNDRYNPYSYKQAMEKCGAMRMAAENNGRGTSYDVWFLALRSAALSTEGRDYAHEISSGHPDYDEIETDKKLDNLTGGPANKDAWARACGAGGPCDSCEWNATCKNPAVQYGTVVNVSPPGEVAAVEPDSVVEWVRELNQRFALVRHGTKMVIVDFKTPSMTGRGVVEGFGFLDIAAFTQMLRGRLAPVDNPKDKARPLATAWLEHPDRRQYAGLVFAPGAVLPPDILNLWQGYAVEPVAGDVALWLEVLAALVPKASDRAYVRRWLAWKIQNPGGVPDTILILKGAKGTGKNSLFDPLVLLFGRHAMLADDPELIAGRFTWHLMTLSFAVLDEAVFVGDPRQMDRIKSRVTAKTMQYEQKGMDPVSGVNRCAYVMLTNHDHVWQATTDERRAVVVEVGEGLRGDLEFWGRYHTWAAGPGPAALLHYLQGIDLTGFNPRQIPKGEALRKQVEQTALRVPAAAWWHQCLSEGAIRWGGTVIYLSDTEDTEVNREALRMSYEQSAAARVRNGNDWPAVSRKVKDWTGEEGIRKLYKRAETGGRTWVEVFSPLSELREAFTAATQVVFDD